MNHKFLFWIYLINQENIKLNTGVEGSDLDGGDGGGDLVVGLVGTGVGGIIG